MRSAAAFLKILPFSLLLLCALLQFIPLLLLLLLLLSAKAPAAVDSHAKGVHDEEDGEAAAGLGKESEEVVSVAAPPVCRADATGRGEARVERWQAPQRHNSGRNGRGAAAVVAAPWRPVSLPW